MDLKNQFQFGVSNLIYITSNGENLTSKLLRRKANQMIDYNNYQWFHLFSRIE
jgi:hypothetical protein